MSLDSLLVTPDLSEKFIILLLFFLSMSNNDLRGRACDNISSL